MSPSEIFPAVDWNAVREWMVLVGGVGAVLYLWVLVLQVFEPRKRLSQLREWLRKTEDE